MFATHPSGFWADLLISVNPIEFGRIAFKYFPNEANQLMINANISITGYFSLIESYPGLGNAYLSNLKNTLMNMGYTAAGWTYLADEHHIYGSSRVGVHNTHFVLAKRFSTAEMEYTQKTGNQVHFIRGKRNYELSNHLGNVQVVISDKRISVCDNELQTERFEADILMATDYYPFGMAIPERQWYTGSDSSNYRFGFNGHEKDDEWQGVGSIYTTEFRQYDPRLGRWLSLDPLAADAPDWSPYRAYFNNPIIYVDPNGLWEADTKTGSRGNKQLVLRGQKGDSWRSLARQTGLKRKEVKRLLKSQFERDALASNPSISDRDLRKKVRQDLKNIGEGTEITELGTKFDAINDALNYSHTRSCNCWGTALGYGITGSVDMYGGIGHPVVADNILLENFKPRFGHAVFGDVLRYAESNGFTNYAISELTKSLGRTPTKTEVEEFLKIRRLSNTGNKIGGTSHFATFILKNKDATYVFTKNGWHASWQIMKQSNLPSTYGGRTGFRRTMGISKFKPKN